MNFRSAFIVSARGSGSSRWWLMLWSFNINSEKNTSEFMDKLKTGDWVSAKTTEGYYIEGEIFKPNKKEQYAYVDVNWIPAEGVISQSMMQVEWNTIEIAERSSFTTNDIKDG